MNLIYVIIGVSLAAAAVTGLLVLAARKGWLHRSIRREEKSRLSCRLWHRGGRHNYMELCQKPDGSLIYHVHRAYKIKCPRCLHVNSSGWQWTVNHAEGLDPLEKIGSPRLDFRCTRCGDVQSFIPQLGPSEWHDGDELPR